MDHNRIMLIILLGAVIFAGLWMIATAFFAPDVGATPYHYSVIGPLSNREYINYTLFWDHVTPPTQAVAPPFS